MISAHARPQGYILAWLRKNCRRTCGLCTSPTRERSRADQYTPKKVFVATVDSKWNTDHVPLFEDLRKSSFTATMHLDSILHFGFLTSSHRTQNVSEADAIFVPMVNTNRKYTRDYKILTPNCFISNFYIMGKEALRFEHYRFKSLFHPTSHCVVYRDASKERDVKDSKDQLGTRDN